MSTRRQHTYIYFYSSKHAEKVASAPSRVRYQTRKSNNIFDADHRPWEREGSLCEIGLRPWRWSAHSLSRLFLYIYNTKRHSTRFSLSLLSRTARSAIRRIICLCSRTHFPRLTKRARNLLLLLTPLPFYYIYIYTFSLFQINNFWLYISLGKMCTYI